MRNFDFLFNEKGEVNTGLEVVVIPEDWFYGPRIANLAGYRPYYTDGTPDPANDEVDESCYIEVYGKVEDLQVCLENLFEFNRLYNVKKLYDGEEVEILGFYEDQYGDRQYAFMLHGELKFAEDYELEDRRSICDLDETELEWFYGHCTHGSIFTRDYRNTLGIEANEACAYAESWNEAVESGEYENTFEDYREWVSSLCA